MPRDLKSQVPSPALDSSQGSVAELFLRVLGGVYLAAFASLWPQVEGLIGSRGILPASALFDWVRLRTGVERYWLLPSVFWFDCSDTSLKLVCGAGVVLSMIVILGFGRAATLFPLWAFYLSLTTAGQIFMGYQWDALLLEAGFLAIFLAPPGLRRSPSPREVLFLLRWLLFRLMLSSGIVKLASGDPAWRSLEALRYHYETQPLPTWIGYYAHQLPSWFQTLSAAALFGVELGTPWLMFGPRRLRLVAAAANIALQTLIALTGNYGFFNFLSIALCLLLLDDRSLPSRLKPNPPLAPGWSWPRLVPRGLMGVVFLMSAMEMSATAGLSVPWPAPVRFVGEALSPFRVINSYGLFAVMTTSRDEIVIEGSRDGRTWSAYEFPWKPGDPKRAPGFVAPHQPRLDWQMWFAALSGCEQNPWFTRLLVKIGEGSPQVLGLLQTNPFPLEPPLALRATLYRYRFADLAARGREGSWWQREPVQLYCPVMATSASEGPVP